MTVAWVWPEPGSEVFQVETIMLSLTADSPIPREQVQKGFSASWASRGQFEWIGNVLRFRSEDGAPADQEVTVALKYPGLSGGEHRFSFKTVGLPEPRFSVTVMEDRWWEGASSADAPVHAVRSGDTIYVWDGLVTADLQFGWDVDQKTVEKGLVVSQPGRQEWMASGSNYDRLWLSWDKGPVGQEITVTLKSGTPLGGKAVLEEDFSFRLIRKAPPAFKVELVEGSLPGGKQVDWDSFIMGEGAFLPPGPKKFRLIFDREMDKTSVERAVYRAIRWTDRYAGGLGSREVSVKWSGERTVDVSVGRTEAGWVHRIDPSGAKALDGMVLAGLRPLKFSMWNAGEVRTIRVSGGDSEKIAPLDALMRPGEISPDGKKVLLRETFILPEEVDWDAPEPYRPWVLNLGTGEIDYWQSPGRWGVSAAVRWLSDSTGFLVVSEGNLVIVEYPGMKSRIHGQGWRREKDY